MVVSFVDKLDLTAYIVVFYLCVATVLVVIFLFFYVSYSQQRRKFSFVWPLQALRTICRGFTTVLFLPLLRKCFKPNLIEMFTSMIACEN